MVDRQITMAAYNGYQRTLGGEQSPPHLLTNNGRLGGWLQTGCCIVCHLHLEYESSQLRLGTNLSQRHAGRHAVSHSIYSHPTDNLTNGIVTGHGTRMHPAAFRLDLTAPAILTMRRLGAGILPVASSSTAANPLGPVSND